MYIEKLKDSIKGLKESIAFTEAILRLSNNPDFNTVVKQGYFKDEAVRLVMLLGDRNLNTGEARDLIHSDLGSIASFKAYLDFWLNQLDSFKAALIEEENALVQEEIENA